MPIAGKQPSRATMAGVAGLAARVLLACWLGACPPAARAAQLHWTAADTRREVAYDALLLVDARQTVWASEHGWSESNPLLGRHPGRGAIERHFVEAAALHAVVSALLPALYRRHWQWGSLAVEAFAVGRNAWLGVQLRF